MHLKLGPGEPLLERDLSDRLGISRTPVREALLLLEREGWVVSGERKGFVVADISPADVAEISSLRRANECLAVELALPRITPADLAHLDELYSRQAEFISGPLQENVRVDHEFHAYLAYLSGNRRLAALLRNLSDHMLRFGIAAVTRSGRARAALAEHRRVLDALHARDLAAATVAMAEHLQNTQSAILVSLSVPREEKSLR